MRISTSQINYRNTTSILQNQTDLFNTSQQLGTGKRVLTPSDDPVSSTLAFNAKNKLSNIDQYGKNIDYAVKSLRTSESALDSIHNRLTRARALMIQANNDTIGDDGRKTIGLEIREITDQLEKFINTKDEQGNYIFSGSKVDTPPFAKQSNGSYSYQGDGKEREVQISDSVKAALNMTGKEIFEDIPSAMYDPANPVKSYPAEANSGAATITVASGSPAFLDGHQIGDYKIEVNPTNPPSADSVVSITDPTGTVLFSDTTDTTALPPADTYIDDVMLGAMTQLETHLNSGADGSTGGLAFNPVTGADQGDSFTLRINNEKQDMLTGMQRFAETLENYSGEDYQKDLLSSSLDDVDSWLNSVEVARTEHGTRRNGVDAIGQNNASVEIFLKEQVSTLEDIDWASAMSEFILQKTALEASQQTFSKISSLSLFNYMN
jgi:flagellar hook-associated protein 3 FlgL